MEGYHETATPSVTQRFGVYAYVVVPPIQLVFNAILDHCGVGGSITPGIRVLSDWSNVTRGLITDCLRQLDADGWISYDGRVITLLRDPREAPESDRSADRSLRAHLHQVIDQLIDQSAEEIYCDRSADRSLSPTPLLAAVQRVLTRQNGHSPSARPMGQSDRSADRSAAPDSHPPHTPPMVIHDLAATESAAAHESALPWGVWGEEPTDRSADHPAALVMAELGCHPVIIARAFARRPDWTPEQVRARWEYDQKRIAASGGTKGPGIFYEAISLGQLAPPEPSSVQVDWSQYAGQEGYAVGDPDPAPAPPPATDPVLDRARAIAPPNLNARDFDFLLEQLAAGASDDQALDALTTRLARSQRLRGGP